MTLQRQCAQKELNVEHSQLKATINPACYESRAHHLPTLFTQLRGELRPASSVPLFHCSSYELPPWPETTPKQPVATHPIYSPYPEFPFPPPSANFDPTKEEETPAAEHDACARGGVMAGEATVEAWLACTTSSGALGARAGRVAITTVKHSGFHWPPRQKEHGRWIRKLKQSPGAPGI